MQLIQQYFCDTLFVVEHFWNKRENRGGPGRAVV